MRGSGGVFTAPWWHLVLREQHCAAGWCPQGAGKAPEGCLTGAAVQVAQGCVLYGQQCFSSVSVIYSCS